MSHFGCRAIVPFAESEVLPYHARHFVLPDFASHFSVSLPILGGWPETFALLPLENFALLRQKQERLEHTLADLEIMNVLLRTLGWLPCSPGIQTKRSEAFFRKQTKVRNEDLLS